MQKKIFASIFLMNIDAKILSPHLDPVKYNKDYTP